jgi:hypothetical protein
MVWVSQYRQYAAERIRPPRLEEPLESYSARELERWVLLRRSSSADWKREDVNLARSRHIRQQSIGTACIVPGGRWLLVGDERCGSVTVYDMDAPVLTGRILIPQDDEHRQPVEHIAIEADWEQKSSTFSFTMALSPFYHDSKILLFSHRNKADPHQIPPPPKSTYGGSPLPDIRLKRG